MRGNKLSKQLSEVGHITNFYKLWEMGIKFFYYFKTVHKRAWFKYGKGLKILTLKHILQTLTIALAQTEAGNTYENLPNGISQIIYSLYWEKEITKKVHNNIINSIKL